VQRTEVMTMTRQIWCYCHLRFHFMDENLSERTRTLDLHFRHAILNKFTFLKLIIFPLKFFGGLYNDRIETYVEVRQHNLFLKINNFILQ
jgi:hypothetical protein